MVDTDFTPGGMPDGGSDRYHHLVEHVQDAVAEFELVDEEPIVRDVNEAFVDSFGYDAEDLEDEPLNGWIVPDWLDEEARTLDERTAAGEINYRRVKRETTGGLREFLYRGIPYEDGGTRTDGFAVYTDLTEITRRERRLQVLNRVLRHNLRNNANVILGHTSQLLDRLQEQTAETASVAATIERAASDLETLTREAADIETVLSRTREEDSAVDCVPLIRAIVEDHRRRSPGAAVETELPESMEVNADEHLRLAIDSLVENAIEHHHADSPRVQVRVVDDGAEGWARIHVEDDGPMIPADERDVVTGAADITPTRHATGLGLWLVKWTTETFGGELSFATSELGGNDVCIRIPRR